MRKWSWITTSRIGLMALPICLAACAQPAENAVEDAAADAVTTTTTTRELNIGGIVTAKKETSITEPSERLEEPVSDRERPNAQSGVLTAGDYDDLLNPELYADYATRFRDRSGEQLPFVDTRSRVAFKVVDRDGRPVPFARVDVGRKGTPLRLVAAADGVASFYPAFDRVPAKTDIRIASQAGAAGRALDLTGSGGRRISVSLPGQAAQVSAMDLALMIDTTGSMGDEMAFLQAELDAIISRLKREAGNLDLRISVIAYRDEGDEYVVRATPLTKDIGAVRETLATHEASGGGDLPEAVDRAMAAAERMQWRADAAKAILFVADAPPHESGMMATLTSTGRLRAQGVQIVSVAASGVEENAQYLMRTMAALTQGRYIFLTDDSGVGNLHAEPDINCYVVTRLDQLIARVLAGMVQGRRIEAGQGEVIRTVGDYDRGRCRGDGMVASQG
jgi:Mg-chelatase subunit ChlD